MASKSFFDEKILEVEQNYEKTVKSRHEQKVQEIRDIENKRKLYELFQDHLRGNQSKTVKLYGRGFCTLCHYNFKLNDYAQKIIIDDSIYCDVHGQLVMNHKPIHEEFVEDCQDCAILYCPFRNPDHLDDAEQCPDCYDAFF